MRNIDFKLWSAIYKGLEQYVEDCVENGADVESKNNYKQTPLIYSCKHKNYGIAEYLLQRANLNERDIYGKTALMYVCENGDYDIAYYLVDKGADVNIKDKQGKTVLMYVCENMNNEKEREYLVKHLIINGADIKVKDKEGRNLLEYAKKGNMPYFVVYILSFSDYFKGDCNKDCDFNLYMKNRIDFYLQNPQELNKIINPKRKIDHIEVEPVAKKQRVIGRRL